MSTQRPKKRKREKGPMVIGEVDSAQLVTPKTTYVTKKDGTVVPKEIWVSLDQQTPEDKTDIDKPQETLFEYSEPADIPSPQPERSQTVR